MVLMKGGPGRLCAAAADFVSAPTTAHVTHDHSLPGEAKRRAPGGSYATLQLL